MDNTDHKAIEGFTLIELLIVIAIIAILASIALFQYRDFYQRSMESGMVTDARNAVTAMESLFTDCQTYVGAAFQNGTTGAGGQTSILGIPTINCITGAASNQNIRVSTNNTLAAPGNLSANTFQVTVSNQNARNAHQNVRIDQTGTISWF